MNRIIIEGETYQYSRKEVAEAIHVHPNTVDNILRNGKHHPKFWRVMRAIARKHGLDETKL
ncbi:hypothetical protein AGMMS49965_24220 [Bacteroidia bacterium]|nr:hypothetical protein AGMMS49965_24220 [Bacteroidia bacterium]